MDVWRLLGAAFRRWYVLVPLLLLTATASWFARSAVDPEYESEGIIQLVRPSVDLPETNETAIVNPYLDLATTAQSLRFTVSSAQYRSDFAAAGLQSDYLIELAARSPIASITVRSRDPELARETGTAVIDEMESLLVERQQQAGIPDDSRVTLEVLDPPDDGLTDVTTSQTRVAIVVLLVGGLVSFFAAVLADDALILVRRFRSSRTNRGSGAGQRAKFREPEESTAAVYDERHAPEPPARQPEPASVEHEHVTEYGERSPRAAPDPNLRALADRFNTEQSGSSSGTEHDGRYPDRAEDETTEFRAFRPQ